MRITKVIATDSQSKEKQIFTFGIAGDGEEIVTTNGGHLNSYLEFCFREESENVKDVETIFTLNDDEFSLSRIHNEDGTTRSVLKKRINGHWQVVARNKNALSYIEEILQEQVVDMLKVNYVNNIAVENFHGDLMVFDQIRMLKEVGEEILQSSAEARAMRERAMQRVREYAAGTIVPVSTEQLEEVSEKLANNARDITIATAQLGEMKAKQTVGNIRLDIAVKLEETQRKYKMLAELQNEIEEARKKVKLFDEIAVILPRVKSLQLLEQQRAEYEKKRYAITIELEWQENELLSVNQQLEEKQRQYAMTQDKRNRIEAINAELSRIAQLYEENKKLNEALLDLNDRQQRLTSERVLYLNKLSGVESSLAEVRSALEAFNIPARSVGELLESVRIDVKIDEITSQIERIQSEIVIKESQIAEKESALVIQVKRFRSVAELDVAVTPMKAKTTILQVLDAKYSRLETINLSLREKLRNLERALEDFRYRILELENSRSKLDAELKKALLRKQEEFKRDVFLNSQKIYNEDASGVFAVTVDFHDQEIDALEQEIAQRSAERDQLVEQAAALDGAIREIKRHIEINAAEMETLQAEKNNINNRYNEIVAQNSSEAVFNYLKALNSDSGTKYLLDVQQEAVRSEAELTELKRTVESLRSKLTALKSRLRYLQETQSQLDTSATSVDTLISTNDQVKESLTDISERLAAGYEQYASICRQLEGINSKLDDVNAAIVETTKTIKVNEEQIAQATEKAKRFAGSDDIEQAVANFRYELGDVESERQMLLESKQTMEKDLFKMRLELEKAQWLYDTKTAEYNGLYQELQFELQLNDLDIAYITSLNWDDASIETLRSQILEYDTKKASLAERIENYYNILRDEEIFKITNEQIEQKQREVEQLIQRQAELEKLRKQQMELYVSASAVKMRVTVAAAEAKTLATLGKTISHNDIIGLLIADKINSILALATQYLNTFIDKSYELTEEGGILVVNVAGKKCAYDELAQEIKTAVFVSLILAVPNTDATDGKWIVFEERINIDKKTLSAMLLKIDNISYVIKYSREAAPKTTED